MNVIEAEKSAHPRISVIMPSLNVAKYITECVESVRNQSLFEIEILCVDAGSTDGTYEILRDFAEKDSRIKIICSTQKSYGYQMNLALEAARGEYIGIVETDDYADLEMFERLYVKASANDLDVVKSNYYCHTEEKDMFFELFAGLPYGKVIQPNDYPSLVMRRPAIWSGIYKKEFLDKNHIRFLETPGASYQDTSFIMKVWICAERVCLDKDAYLHYRMDNPNSSVKSYEKSLYVRDEMRAAFAFLEAQPEKKRTFIGVLWDHEADTYEWNFKRLADELKYDFLKEIQGRFQEGLDQGIYVRQHMRHQVWNMVQQVADNPLLFLRGRCSEEVYTRLLETAGDNKPSNKQIRRWMIKQNAMLVPETVVDVFCFARNYGIPYCISAVLKKNQPEQ